MKLFYQRSKKIFCGIFLFVLLIGSFSLSSFAVDIQLPDTEEDGEIVHNEERIDPFTGEVITDEEDTKKEEETQGYQATYVFNDKFYYDVSNDRYVYRFGSLESESVYCNIANGMYTNDPVSINFGNGIRYDFYRNGKEVEKVDLTNMTEPGNYVFRLTSLDNKSLGTFSFRITDTYTNTALYQIPEYFTVVEAICDGKAQLESSNQVSMESEGVYLIVIQNNLNQKTYSYQAIVDHTAPTLKLEAVSETMMAKSAVDISDLEAGVDLKIYWNDELISKTGQLTTPGKYTLILTDPAGNMTTYQFIIYLYFTVTSTVIIGFIGLAILGLIVYLIVSRKSIRVR